jgi:hypothetical protein
VRGLIEGNFWVIAAIASVITTAATVLIASMLLIALRNRSVSKYDDIHKHAQLSAMREAYDKQLHEINKQLLSTEERWKEINHLLISAQRLQPDGGNVGVPYTRFLRAAGITQTDLSVDPKLVLVLTPFDPIYAGTYKTITDVCQRVGLRCLRGDEEYTREDILSHILKIMVRSRLIIANVSGRNPNVFYELGIAHAMDKTTILISEGLDLPFDVQSKRILVYQTDEALRKELTEAMLRAMSEVES